MMASATVEALTKQRTSYAAIPVSKICDMFEYLIYALATHWQKPLSASVLSELFTILNSELGKSFTDSTSRFAHAYYVWYLFICAECTKLGVPAMSTEERLPPKYKRRIKINISPIRTSVKAPVQSEHVLQHTQLIMRYFCGLAKPQVVTELDATIKALDYKTGSLNTTKLKTWIRENLVTSHEDPLVRVLGTVQHQGNMNEEKIVALQNEHVALKARVSVIEDYFGISATVVTTDEAVPTVAQERLLSEQDSCDVDGLVNFEPADSNFSTLVNTDEAGQTPLAGCLFEVSQPNPNPNPNPTLSESESLSKRTQFENAPSVHESLKRTV
jgi:hypothetical protein